MSTPPSPFRYFRDPHHFSSYTDTGEVCPFCGLVRPGYGGGFFGLDTEGYDFICEVCLLEGKLAEKDLTINEGSILHPERISELEQRTPAIMTWQQLLWPAHCGDFCCFLKEAGQLDLQRLAPDDDGQRFFEDHMEERQEDVWKNIRPDAPVDNSMGWSIGVYLFQCLECGEYVIQWDCD